MLTVAVCKDKFPCFQKKMEAAFADFTKEYHTIEENATMSIVDAEDEAIARSKMPTQNWMSALRNAVYP